MVNGGTDGTVSVVHYDTKGAVDSPNYPILTENAYDRYVTNNTAAIRVTGYLNHYYRSYPGVKVYYRQTRDWFSGMTNGSANTLHSLTWAQDSFSDYATLRSQVINKALNKGYDKARVQGGVFFAELHQVRRMIFDRASNLAGKLQHVANGDAWRALKRERSALLRGGARVNAARVNRFQRDAVNNYLEYAYGVLPLVSDIKSGAEFIASLSLKETTFRVQHKYHRELDVSYTLPSPSFKIVSYAKHIQKKSLDIKCVLHIDYEDEESYSNFGQFLRGAFLKRAGLDITQLPLIGWELIPYSFLLDYVVNIGDFLQYRFDPLPITAATLSTKVQYDRGEVVGSFKGTGYNLSSTEEFYGTLEDLSIILGGKSYRYKREVLPTSNLGTIEVNRDTSLIHAFNVGALAWQKVLKFAK